MMKTFQTRGLAGGSLFKLLFIGLLIPVFIFGVGCGVASFFGYQTVTFNGQQVYGMQGLITGALIGLFVPVFMAAFLWCLIWFGVWVWTRVWMISLSIKD